MTNATMTRREFAGWMVASVVAMVAGTRVWKLFRRLAESGDAHEYVTYVSDVDVGRGTITLTTDQHGRRWSAQIERAPEQAVQAMRSAMIAMQPLVNRFNVGDPVVVLRDGLVVYPSRMGQW